MWLCRAWCFWAGAELASRVIAAEPHTHSAFTFKRSNAVRAAAQRVFVPARRGAFLPAAILCTRIARPVFSSFSAAFRTSNARDRQCRVDDRLANAVAGAPAAFAAVPTPANRRRHLRRSPISRSTRFGFFQDLRPSPCRQVGRPWLDPSPPPVWPAGGWAGAPAGCRPNRPRRAPVRAPWAQIVRGLNMHELSPWAARSQVLAFMTPSAARPTPLLAVLSA